MTSVLIIAAAATSVALPTLPLPLEEVWFHIRSSAMAPALPEGSIAVAEPLAGPAARGEVVLVRSVDQPNKRYALRVVGLPGERIEFDDGFPVIGGQKFKDLVPWIPPMQIGWAKFPSWNTAYAVPPNSYYLLADNHKEPAYDSLVFGAVPRELILGTLTNLEAVQRTPGRVRAALIRALSSITARLPLDVGDGYVLTGIDVTDNEISATYRTPPAQVAWLREHGRNASLDALCQNRLLSRVRGFSVRYSFEGRSAPSLKFRASQSECARR